jgi:PEP-utilising enzyme, PEP-binding domain
MIPLVAYEGELELTRARVLAVAEEEGFTYGRDFGVGTMIELPRACFIADRIARHADFFSFGTNDLTQTAIGFSRDDVEGRIIPRYVAERILDISPFASIDEAGVGELVQTAVRRGRRGRANIELGICGEHGGDPDSIRFFHRAGLDYVSCSPFRLPIARVAAAQTAISAPRPAPGGPRASSRREKRNGLASRAGERVKLFVLLQRGVRRRASWGVGAAVGGADSPTDISSASTRSVGARMNTSHIMSGCCWLPLMKPITRRPVACSITASNRSRMTSWNSIR